MENTLTTLSSILICTTFVAQSIADEIDTIGEQATIETISVKGHRNTANSEINEHTEQLFDIAGSDNDPLQAVYSLPGVVYAGGDAGGEPAIRGSSPNDNAFYIDGLPVDYIYHLFGDSIFNQHLIQDFSLHSAGFDSQFGDVVGGVFDVRLRDPKQQQLTTTVDWSFLKAGLMTEGATTDDQAFYFSYRKSLIHFFLDEGSELEDESGITIYQAPQSDDYQGKYQWLIGNDKLTLTLAGASDYGGADVAEHAEAALIDPDSVGKLSIDTEFNSQSLSWTHYGRNNSLTEIIAGHTSTSQRTTMGSGQYVDIINETTNANASYLFHWHANHQLNLGVSLQNNEGEIRYDSFEYFCTEFDVDCKLNKGERVAGITNIEMLTSAAYMTNRWQLNNNWHFDSGLRWEHNDYLAQTFVLPRLSLTWQPQPAMSVTAKAGQYQKTPETEYIVQDLGNPNLKSPTAEHYSLTFELDIADNWQTSIDVYYKELHNLVRAVKPNESHAEQIYDNQMSGRAIGAEWLLRRLKDDGWYGWMSLSWSESKRADNTVNQESLYQLDTPYVFNLVANYDLNYRWTLATKLSARSGALYTPVVGITPNPDHVGFYLPEYGKANSERLPTYQRLDIQVNYHSTLWGQDTEWSFAILNALNSENITDYYFAPNGTETEGHFNIEKELGLERFLSLGVKTRF